MRRYAEWGERLYGWRGNFFTTKETRTNSVKRRQEASWPPPQTRSNSAAAHCGRPGSMGRRVNYSTLIIRHSGGEHDILHYVRDLGEDTVRQSQEIEVMVSS
ncbi:hypothetical protein IW261DRAFT_1426468 [Armillaria novae-zelandiae]|uniref:Uncharacterized protein n=1 Tax=Armillaria novae-zelandiae TaxID=153914 RepID=A0AA39NL41_9AGAR|nr:hypothetical protein IW261DRAFT_1426468 [Armillaria novae-zelandiae]